MANGDDFNPDNLKRISEQAGESSVIFNEIRNAAKDLDRLLSKVANRLGDDVQKAFREGAKSVNDLNKKIANLADGTSKVNQLVESGNNLRGNANTLADRAKVLADRAKTSTGQTKALLEKQAENLARASSEAQRLANFYDQAAAAATDLDSNVQFFKGASDFVSSIPGLKAFSAPFKQAETSAKKALLSGKTSAEAFSIAVKEFDASIGKLLLTFLSKSLFDANQQITNIRKNLGVSGFEAFKIRNQFSGIAALSGDIRVNSAAILKTNQELNNVLGTALVFETETLETATKVLDAKILTAEAASNLASIARINGQTSKEALLDQEAVVNSVNAEKGTRISLKGVLEASNKVSGQLRAQLGGSAEAIAEAVTTAKALGMELDQLASAGRQLLEFESSISAELDAELLTGKQLNLERARLLALNGDLKGLAEELTNEIGNFSDFSQMNVLQQEALAKSVGMTADQLSDTLFKQADLNQLIDEAKAMGDEQRLNDLLALSNQEKFAKAVEQVKNAFVDLMVILSPVTALVGFIASAISTLPGKIALIAIGFGKLIPYLKTAKLLSIGKAIATMFSSPLGIVGGVLGTAALMTALAKGNSTKLALGGIVPASAGGTLATIGEGGQAEAVVPLNRAKEMGFGGTEINYDKMASAMSKAQVNVSTKYDSFGANSTSANGGRYQSTARYESKFV
jgi:biotin operon repressor